MGKPNENNQNKPNCKKILLDTEGINQLWINIIQLPVHNRYEAMRLLMVYWEKGFPVHQRYKTQRQLYKMKRKIISESTVSIRKSTKPTKPNTPKICLSESVVHPTYQNYIMRHMHKNYLKSVGLSYSLDREKKINAHKFLSRGNVMLI